MSNYIPSSEGEIIDVESLKTVGRHQGCMYYTYAQRKGLNISSHMGPWFVCAKDLANNRLYVAKGEKNPWLFASSCLVQNYHCLFQAEERRIFHEEGKLICHAQFRHRQEAQAVTLYDIKHEDVPKAISNLALAKTNEERSFVFVKFSEPLTKVSPGQECVFFSEHLCGGGGQIAYIFKGEVEWQAYLDAYLAEATS